VRGLAIGSIGIGTYLSSLSPGFDRKARGAITSAAANGCNLIDTARNYRGGRSETVVGDAIRALSAAGVAERDELIVCSKAGYVFERDARVCPPSASIVDANILSPAFLSSQIAVSLERTGLEAIDIYLLHNPELHLPKLGVRKFYRTLTSCFEVLERYVSDGKLGMYGLACWSGFDQDTPMLIDISKIMRQARLAGGNARDNFGAIETPLNWVHRNPVAAPANRPLARICQENDLMLIGSSSLLGGRLARLPSALAKAFPGKLSDAQRSIQYARSIPGVSVTLVGMNRQDHIKDNLRLRRLPVLRKTLVQRLTSALDTV
jgi:aryl-alcohol dehydrogenase-like predicted oxidoreductase